MKNNEVQWDTVKHKIHVWLWEHALEFRRVIWAQWPQTDYFENFDIGYLLHFIYRCFRHARKLYHVTELLNQCCLYTYIVLLQFCHTIMAFCLQNPKKGAVVRYYGNWKWRHLPSSFPNMLYDMRYILVFFYFLNLWNNGTHIWAQFQNLLNKSPSISTYGFLSTAYKLKYIPK